MSVILLEISLLHQYHYICIKPKLPGISTTSCGEFAGNNPGIYGLKSSSGHSVSRGEPVIDDEQQYT